MNYNKVEICGVNTSKLKVLTEKEKRALLTQMKNGTPQEQKKAREELINGNLRLVLSVIQRFTNRGENLDDLFQVGCIGLIKAIDNFDISQDVRFSTYGVPMIIGEIRRFLRDNNSVRVSRSLRDTAYKAMQVKERLTTQNNKEPSIEEIAKELELDGIMEPDEELDITLLVGLPPAHYGQLYSRFEQYFLRKREVVDFEYNGRYYSIRITKVVSYTQALAAAVTKYGELKKHAASYIIDIGGYTVDVLKLRYGKPDLAVVESFEQGVITLYNSIASQCNSQFALHLEDCDIDEVIRGEPTILPGEVQILIRKMANQFLTELCNFLGERGIDLKVSKCVFAGGGSMLLRSIIERSDKVGFPIFIDDIHANAQGYLLLYKSEEAAHGSK